MSAHQNQRLRHPLQFRHLQVLRSESPTPKMRRIVLGGPQLQGFVSAAPDDHFKLFFPNGEGQFVVPTLTAEGLRYPEGQLPSPGRDYTPRHYDAQAGELVVDFVLHGDGPAASWAASAEVGAPLVVAGPRGSFVVADDYDHYVLVGDETALPAIARWLQQMPAHSHAQVFIEIDDAGERQPLHSDAEVQVHWLERNGFAAADSTLLEDSLRDLEPPEGDTFYWIAAESRRARAMRMFIEQHYGVDKDSIRATGYWKADGDTGTDDTDR
jgi:NADPH-dependent ferric siderophore reductase